MDNAAAAKAAEAADAAARLRHDLARYIRLSAPEALEASTDALRDRLRSDVLSTRRGPSGEQSAADVFEQWRREEEGRFPAGSALAQRVARIGQSIREIRGLAAEIGALARPQLERLDFLTRQVAQECRALAAEARDAEKEARKTP